MDKQYIYEGEIPSDERILWMTTEGEMWTDRNKVDWRKRVKAFKTLLSGLEVKSVLELGCNRGYNLETLKHVSNYDMTGMDICSYPLSMPVSKDLKLVQGDIMDIPFPDNSFDLVFTVAVLLYFDSKALRRIAEEINRVSKRYFLAIEYCRNKDNVMDNDTELQCRFIPSPERWWESICFWWARDYGHFLPGLVDKRVLSPEQGFGEGCGWWLFDKNIRPEARFEYLES